MTFGPFTAYQNAVAGAWMARRAETLAGAVLAGNASGAVLVRGTPRRFARHRETANHTTSHPPETVRGGVRIGGHRLDNAPRVRDVTFVRQPVAAIDVDDGYG